MKTLKTKLWNSVKLNTQIWPFPKRLSTFLKIYRINSWLESSKAEISTCPQHQLGTALQLLTKLKNFNILLSSKKKPKIFNNKKSPLENSWKKWNKSFHLQKDLETKSNPFGIWMIMEMKAKSRAILRRNLSNKWMRRNVHKLIFNKSNQKEKMEQNYRQSPKSKIHRKW